MTGCGVYPEGAEPPTAVAALAERVEADGGHVLARTTPLSRQRKTLPSFDQTFEKLTENLTELDVTTIHYQDIAKVAVPAAPAV